MRAISYPSVQDIRLGSLVFEINQLSPELSPSLLIPLNPGGNQANI
jgi:hypothetical protein